jgi:hypothetical protein
MVYHSFEDAEDDTHNYYPLEFLNSLTPNGLPPHVLKLKINWLVILLKNIDPLGQQWHKAGVRAVCLKDGLPAWDHIVPPSNNEMLHFWFKRKQFPFGLS